MSQLIMFEFSPNTLLKVVSIYQFQAQKNDIVFPPDVTHFCMYVRFYNVIELIMAHYLVRDTLSCGVDGKPWWREQ